MALIKTKTPSVAKSLSTNLLNLPLKPHYGIKRGHSTPGSIQVTSGATPLKSFRVVVLGVGGVGKTALTVRFMTNRFIGDYDPNLESIYYHTCFVDDCLVEFQVLDTASGQNTSPLMLEDKCKWGEAFIFVYDVTDKYSFDELTRLKFVASYTHANMKTDQGRSPVCALIGNKTDLALNERMVTTEEGRKLSDQLRCHIFREISVKETIQDSRQLFADLWRQSRNVHGSCSSPRSLSRKLSGKIYNNIPILKSRSCMKGEKIPVLPSNNTEPPRNNERVSSKHHQHIKSLGRRNAISFPVSPPPNDALHGSKSSYRKRDALLMTSSSGESDHQMITSSVRDMRLLNKRR